MKKLKAGIIGLGVGEAHIAGYETSGLCEVVSLCDLDPIKRAQVGKRHSGKRLFKDAGSILRDPSIDIISIASFDNFHVSQVCEALAHGKHVFVEKPLCLNLSEARRIQKALKRAPRQRLSSNLILRMSPRFRQMREMVQRNKLGDVFYAEADYNYGRVHKITEGWRGRIPYYSVTCGGAVHMIDLLTWITGSRVVEVSAYGTRIATKGTQFKHPDCVAALLQMDRGIAKVSSNYSCVYPHSHLVTLYGTQGTLIQNLSGAELITDRTGRTRPKKLTSAYPGAHKGDLIPSFVRSIMGKGEALVSAEDVFQVMAVCFAIDESVQKKRPVKVTAI